MKVEVGKAYRTRDGKKVVVTRTTDDIEYTLQGDNGYSYAAEGYFYHPDGTHNLDLIAEWEEPATPDADGWIPWNGGECPVPDYEVLEIKQRNGVTLMRGPGKFRAYNYWRHMGDGLDVIAYRIVRPATPALAHRLTYDAPHHGTCALACVNVVKNMREGV